MHRFITRSLVFSLFISVSAFGQDLDDLIKAEQATKTDYTTATFKGTRIIHGHSIESPARGVLQSMFSHRFGTLEDPAYTFFGNEPGIYSFWF